MYISTPQDWATSLFGQANLGEPRRTKRLVKVAANLALLRGIFSEIKPTVSRD
jgi:hypothetical protein